MDRLKKARQPVRTAFTRTFNQLLLDVAAENPPKEVLQVKFSKLERLCAELNVLDQKVRDHVLDNGSEEEYAAECEAIEEYSEKLDLARIKVESSLNHAMANLESTQTDSDGSEQSVRTRIRRKLRLPKIELIKFGGDVKDWLTFWSQFKRIHNDGAMAVEDKFQYLIQATTHGSRAREVISSFPPTEENYPKAIECLKSRFGREDLLVEVYVRELLKLVIHNVSYQKEKIVTSKLYDKLESHLRALETIGVTSEKYTAMLFPLVESCLPEDILRAWQRYASSNGGDKKDKNDGNRLEQLLNFMKAEVEGEERISLARAGFGSSDGDFKVRRRSPEDKEVPTAAGLLSGDYVRQRSTCIFCEKSHESKDCFQAQKLPLDDKRIILSSKRCCFSCFRVGHRAKDCKSIMQCGICGRRHWAVMCPESSFNKAKLDIKIVKEKAESRNKEVNSNKTLSNQSSPEEVILQTLVIKLSGPAQDKLVRAIIDTGSHRSYILKKLAVDLGYSPVGSDCLIQSLFGGIESQEEVHQRYEVCVSCPQGGYNCKINMLDQNVICGGIPRIKRSEWFNELSAKKIWISDVGNDSPEIEVLIGADVAGKLLTGQIHQLKSGLVAVETRLGWTIMGKVPGERSAQSSSLMVTSSLFVREVCVSDLWDLDKIGIMDPSDTKSKKDLELAAQEHFTKTVKINSEGRYEINLPWIEGHPEISENKFIAEKRLISTTKKLKEVQKMESYGAVFCDWLNQNIIEKVPEDELGNFGHYLPHRGVFKGASTTKVRPVFDASARTKSTPSLNDCLEKGPNSLELIPTLLNRFREHRIGVISDIEKAFLQIAVSKQDCDYLRFLWWENEAEEKIQVYRHRRVVFGINCGPFLLGAVINHHLRNSTPDLKKTADKLEKSFYVDNCVTSVESEEELYEFIREARKLMAGACFDLRGWENTEIRSPRVSAEPTSVLGILWDKAQDELFCDVQIGEIIEVVTKRRILSTVHKVFDPIGFCCPVILFPKLLLQNAWNLKIGWDTKLPEDISQKFRKWLEELALLSQVKLKRMLSIRGSTRASWSLHTFCDASQSAYAAVVFLRSELDSRVECQLVQAKVRVAPLKKTTIPRLELLGCTIASRLAINVSTDLELTNVPLYFWTDSSTALQWIKKDDQWGTFVGNRVKEINSLTSSESWRHVPGEMNPADLPSRGCTVSQLIKSRWWEGPDWLKTKQWPSMDPIINEEEVNLERKKGIVPSLLIQDADSSWFMKYFSSYSRMVRMAAWIARFTNNVRKKSGDRVIGELSVLEVENAEKILFKLVQIGLDQSSKNSCSIGVFKDESGLVRVKTKITRRIDEECFKCPVLLPSNHALVTALIREEHLKQHHAGVQVLMTTLRERFWILKSRRTIRAVISKCARCKRFQSKKIESLPATLPEDRVRDASTFEIVGVDLAGPLFLKDRKKSWIVLFTCAVYRAVHLELVLSLSTQSFLQSLRRFIARRGRPSTIYSDNGKNFVGSENLFKDLDWNEIERTTSQQRIQWKFNPPSAAWWGGWWERIIGMIKNLLRRILGRSSLHYEELVTVLCDCEAVINSRPLTYVSEDSEDLVPLTPAMFIQDVRETGVPDMDQLDSSGINKRLKYCQNLRNSLRQRFRNEYLSQLVQRGGEASTQSVAVGDVVLVGHDNEKRINWPLARVVEVFPGKDGVVRVLRLKTSFGEMVRPIKRVFPLEFTCQDKSILGKKVKPKHKQHQKVAEQEEFVTRSGSKVKAPDRLLF